MALSQQQSLLSSVIIVGVLAVGFPSGVRARPSSAEYLGPHDKPRPALSRNSLTTAIDHRSPSVEATQSQPGVIADAAPGHLVAVHVPGVFLLPVAQQPPQQPQFVSPLDDVLTEFAKPSRLGSVGLLAHNYLAGADFFLMDVGEEFSLVYDDGRTETFVVSDVARYQALSPDSPYSEFVDLATSERLSASALYEQIYDRPGSVILQTCIAADGNRAWGRLFVIGEPVTP